MQIIIKPQFINKIIEGSKIHTILRDIDNVWEPDISMQFITNAPDYICFKERICKAVQGFEIFYHLKNNTKITIWIESCVDPFNWYRYTYKNNKDFLETLAKNEGFDNFYKFCEFFDTDYTGKIIHWTDLTY